jgi:hypothetical protein
MKVITFAVLISFAAVSPGKASWLSNAVLNTQKTVDKAVKDTNKEVNRAKDKVIGSDTTKDPAASPTPTVLGSPGVAVVSKQSVETEFDQLGKKLTDAVAERITTRDEKKLSDAIIVALISAIVGGIVTMSSTGMLGRHDRREKFLAAVEREWKLESEGFDFARIPNYQRISQAKDGQRNAALRRPPD